MAVVQISRIQVRRGQKNSNTGVPQLSSAELAWAVDTQELFIGNGSVAEGAPYVGNTKILTEHDNILDIASSYRFGSDNPSITNSVSRSLGDKIDEIEVSVLDFGAKGDGSTDNVTAFKNAFEELFQSSDDKLIKTLVIPNGEYVFTDDLDIPSKARIRGETQNGVILNFTASNINFVTSTGLSSTNFTGSNRPVDIKISNLTISRTTGTLNLIGVADSLIEDVVFQGIYVLGDTISSPNNESPAVYWFNEILGIATTGITFSGCRFDGCSLAVKAEQTEIFETVVDFKDCEFQNLYTGLYSIGVQEQINRWTMQDCRFNEIATQAILSTNGIGMKIKGTSFINCGNDINTAVTPSSTIVSFGQSKDNMLIDCSSNRQQNAGITSLANAAYIPEVFNSDRASLSDKIFSQVTLSDSFAPMAVFSADSKYINVTYTLRLNNYRRHGNLVITVDNDKTSAAFTDNYSYSSSSSSSFGGSTITGFQFDVSIEDNDVDSVPETVVLYYKNPIATGFSGNISFDVTYGV